jgi:hypothetical protein
MSLEKASKLPEAPASPSDQVDVHSTNSSTSDEFDQASWVVPVICKDCSKNFALPYRLFKAGVVFHCPHCRGSFVPTSPIYRAVRNVFETFYARRKHELDQIGQAGTDEATIIRRQAVEREAFLKMLDELARGMRPAGKMVKPKGIRAMFT